MLTAIVSALVLDRRTSELAALHVSALDRRSVLRSESRLSYAPQQLSARRLASPACLGADPAVLVVARMALALVTAALADGDTRFEQRPHDVGIVLGRPAEHAGCRSAHVRAVQAQ